ncbi:MAG: PAS domain-containing sensor histidine kinase [Bacteroidetes bacterium]|nr:PAS domain-containing sensor histidine kinase [Bacteroidota bacterium]
MKTEDHNNAVLAEYKKQIEALQDKLDEFEKQQEEDEKLNYAWTGNLGHWYWDIPNNKVRFNALKIKALGYAGEDIPTEVDYQFFTDKLHPDDYKPVMKNMMEHLHGKSPAYEVEYRIRAIDGSYKWYYDRGRITRRDESGKPLFMAGIVFDISKKKEYEEQLADLVLQLKKENHMKNKFISVLAHDLRSPIGLLTSYMYLIKLNIEEKQLDVLKSNVEKIENISMKTYELLNTLIQWAISQEGALDVKKEKIHIGKLIADAVAQQEVIAHEKEISIVTDIMKDIQFRSDPVIISTVLRNLLSNAIKYSHNKSEVKISVSQKEQKLILAVTDEGIGMEQADLDILLSKDKFYESRAGTGGEKGTGIGLNLCKNFIEKLNGKITGISAPQKGTTMFVEIPIRENPNSKK